MSRTPPQARCSRQTSSARSMTYGSHPIWPSEYARRNVGKRTSTPEKRKSDSDAIALLKLNVAATARKRGERQRGVDPVHLHVVEAGLRVVATGAHLVIGDGRHRHVVAVEPDRRHVPLVHVDQVLVHPAVALGTVGVEGLAVC